MRTALGYVRVSTDEQADRGLGLEAQRQRIQGYCQMKGLELGTVFEDPGVSGGKPLGSRLAGDRLLAEARRSRSVVVVARLDRLSAPWPTPPLTPAIRCDKVVDDEQLAGNGEGVTDSGREVAELDRADAEAVAADDDVLVVPGITRSRVRGHGAATPARRLVPGPDRLLLAARISCQCKERREANQAGSDLIPIPFVK